MTSTAWKFSTHAMERLASRFGLLIDMGVEAEISKTLNSYRAKIVAGSGDRVLYKLSIFGVSMVAICNTDKMVVITFIDGENWKRKNNARRRRCNRFRSKGFVESGEEE